MCCGCNCWVRQSSGCGCSRLVVVVAVGCGCSSQVVVGFNVSLHA